eukprot:TRINITY_DN60762_c0_g1_i1.p1 TRINITY_DN60762_c0_g1~~TRINITY_DN60762_c0_g1_i1.p1  ORF type:complete len:210 (-),score=41.78 TRINITY_DN60762_c0_g1_i1:43-672(-)
MQIDPEELRNLQAAIEIYETLLMGAPTLNERSFHSLDEAKRKVPHSYGHNPYCESCTGNRTLSPRKHSSQRTEHEKEKDEDLAECTFRPIISDKAKELKRNIPVVQRFEELERARLQRLQDMRADKSKKEAAALQDAFKPEITPRAKELRFQHKFNERSSLFLKGKEKHIAEAKARAEKKAAADFRTDPEIDDHSRRLVERSQRPEFRH